MEPGGQRKMSDRVRFFGGASEGVSGFAANSLGICQLYACRCSKAWNLGSYELLQGAPGSDSGTQLPAEIRKIIGQSKKENPYAGAYPPMP